jgi:hypothetical protein
MEKIKGARESTGISESEKRILDRASGHFRSLKEQVDRVHFSIEQYRKRPDSKAWNSMMLQIELLEKLSAVPGTLVFDLEHVRQDERRVREWPKGTRTWES